MLNATQERLVRDLKESLTCSTPVERAELLLAVDLAVYDHVKVWVPGGGFDGRDSDERSAVGRMVDAAYAHLDVQREITSNV